MKCHFLLFGFLAACGGKQPDAAPIRTVSEPPVSEVLSDEAPDVPAPALARVEGVLDPCDVPAQQRARCLALGEHGVELWTAETGRPVYTFRDYTPMRCAAQRWSDDAIDCAQSAATLADYHACGKGAAALAQRGEVLTPDWWIDGCPDGGSVSGSPPPDGTAASCEGSGDKDGPATFWYDAEETGGDFLKKMEGVYTAGVREGRWTFWEPFGCLAATGSYRAGLRDGVFTRYSVGEVTGTATYDSGTVTDDHTEHGAADDFRALP